MVKLLIEDGKKIMLDQSFSDEYKRPRDRYWGNDLNKYDLNIRDGSCIDYDEFFQKVSDSEIGIFLQIINFEDKEKVKVLAKGYNQKDLIKDSKSINSIKELDKIIITKKALLDSKTEWDKLEELPNKKISIGVGANSNGNPVVFIHLANEKCFTNESNNPIRIPSD